MIILGCHFHSFYAENRIWLTCEENKKLKHTSAEESNIHQVLKLIFWEKDAKQVQLRNLFLDLSNLGLAQKYLPSQKKLFENYFILLKKFFMAKIKFSIFIQKFLSYLCLILFSQSFSETVMIISSLDIWKNKLWDRRGIFTFSFI